jgi:hypothetical protein
MVPTVSLAASHERCPPRAPDAATIDLRSCQHVAHRLRVPLPVARRGDPARVQSVCDLMQRRCARAPYLADHREHVCRVLIRQRLDGRYGAYAAMNAPRWPMAQRLNVARCSRPALGEAMLPTFHVQGSRPSAAPPSERAWGPLRRRARNPTPRRRLQNRGLKPELGPEAGASSERPGGPRA